MKSPKVSVIVPCYKCEKWVGKCIDSLLKQTLRDIEIICVLDKSPDDSHKIIKEYAQKHPRVSLYENKQRRGVSFSRNLGIAKARAKYIMFCDSDDYYEPDMCEKMYKAITRKGCDAAACGIEIQYESHKEMLISDTNYYALKFKGVQDISNPVIKKVDLSSANKIFKKSLIEEHEIKFPENLRYEDAYFVIAYLCCAKRINFVNEKLYHYVRHDDSIMSNTWSQSGDDSSIEHLEIAINLYAFLKKNNLLARYNELFWHFYYQFALFAFRNCKTKQMRKKIKQLSRDFVAIAKESFVQNKLSRRYQIRRTNLVGEKSPYLMVRGSLSEAYHIAKMLHGRV